MGAPHAQRLSPEKAAGWRGVGGGGGRGKGDGGEARLPLPGPARALKLLHTLYLQIYFLPCLQSLKVKESSSIQAPGPSEGWPAGTGAGWGGLFLPQRPGGGSVGRRAWLPACTCVPLGPSAGAERPWPGPMAACVFPWERSPGAWFPLRKLGERPS